MQILAPIATLAPAAAIAEGTFRKSKRFTSVSEGKELSSPLSATLSSAFGRGQEHQSLFRQHQYPALEAPPRRADVDWHRRPLRIRSAACDGLAAKLAGISNSPHQAVAELLLEFLVEPVCAIARRQAISRLLPYAFLFKSSYNGA
jgi:hypothetical protein